MERKLTHSQLKMIAIALMFIDHVGAFGIEKFLLYAGYFNGTMVHSTALVPLQPIGLYEGLYALDICLRFLGRAAFPLFAFMITEGFLHTGNRKKYFLRLAAFAFISEIPYDLGTSWTLFAPDNQNVFFTLTLGFLCMWGISKARERYDAGAPISDVIAQSLLIIIVTSITAGLLSTDYGACGVLAIVLFYLLRKQRLLAASLACLCLCISVGDLEIGAFLCLIPITFYNGQKGKVIIGKYFFYFFYPLHILGLFAITQMVVCEF